MLFIVAAISGCGGTDEEPPQTKVVKEPSNPQFPIDKDGIITLEPGNNPRDNSEIDLPNPKPKPPKKLRGIVAYASNGEIYTMNPNGSNRKNLTKHKADDSNPVWSPDGKKIAFLSGRADGGKFVGLFVMESDGSNPRRVSNWRAMGTLNARPAWAPNGVHIEIEGFTASMVAWSPDFRQIAFVDMGDSDNQVIKILDVARLTTRALTKGQSSRPAWSPDGKRIAYQLREGINETDPWEIYVVNVDGTGNMNLTRNPKADDQCPTWSPDGRHIIFATFREPDFNWEIYIMESDGSNQANVTKNALADDTHPNWK